MARSELKKHQIIEDWQRDSTQNLEDIADRYDTKPSYVSLVLSGHRKKVTIEKKLWLVNSLSDDRVYYLFDGISERKVCTKFRTLCHPEQFTLYEKNWMHINYGLLYDVYFPGEKKITAKDIQQLKKDREYGKSLPQLVEMYKLPQDLIEEIVAQ